jgi:hypothetical protein
MVVKNYKRLIIQWWANQLRAVYNLICRRKEGRIRIDNLISRGFYK